MQKHTCVIVLAATMIASASCSAPGTAPASPSHGDPLGWSVKTLGPFGCGHRVFATSYAPPGGLPTRTIPVEVWYPTEETEGEHPVYGGLFRDKTALNDVAPAASAYAAGMPVVVHSHGHKGFAGNSARLMCHFASHGWLAVAPEHVGDTLPDAKDPVPLALYIERPLDVRAALDLVRDLPASDPLHGRADLAHVAMTAHSFGTYSGWAVGGASVDLAQVRSGCASGEVGACSDALVDAMSRDFSDARIASLTLMAGAPRPFFATGGYDAVRKPVLMMSGTLNTVSNDKIMDAITKLDIGWATIEGGCHQLFGLGNTVLGDSGCAVLPDEEGFAIVNPYALAFARVHALGDRSDEVRGIVEAPTTLSPRVRYVHESP